MKKHENSTNLDNSKKSRHPADKFVFLKALYHFLAVTWWNPLAFGVPIGLIYAILASLIFIPGYSYANPLNPYIISFAIGIVLSIIIAIIAIYVNGGIDMHYFTDWIEEIFDNRNWAKHKKIGKRIGWTRPSLLILNLWLIFLMFLTLSVGSVIASVYVINGGYFLTPNPDTVRKGVFAVAFLTTLSNVGFITLSIRALSFAVSFAKYYENCPNCGRLFCWIAIDKQERQGLQREYTVNGTRWVSSTRKDIGTLTDSNGNQYKLETGQKGHFEGYSSTYKTSGKYTVHNYKCENCGHTKNNF
ncbi:MAG: hypothetical protein IJZ04_07055 [Clostridia bacterium]|nr:hypothetical protein [Clostridia bacterium]